MELICPQCGCAIPGASVNIATDLAKCESCGGVFRASELVADIDLESNLTPPTGSRIAFLPGPGKSCSFQIPRAGFSPGDVPMMIFATVWTGFIAFWTFLAGGLAGAGGGLPGVLCPVLFSIPFWMVGLAMWIGLINGVMEKQTIELTLDELIIHKNRPFRPKHIKIALDHIDKISVDSVMPRDPFSLAKHVRHFHKMAGTFWGIPLACITHGTKKTHFAEQVSEAETEWLVKVLSAMIFKVSGKRVWRA